MKSWSWNIFHDFLPRDSQTLISTVTPAPWSKPNTEVVAGMSTISPSKPFFEFCAPTFSLKFLSMQLSITPWDFLSFLAFEILLLKKAILNGSSRGAACADCQYPRTYFSLYSIMFIILEFVFIFGRQLNEHEPKMETFVESYSDRHQSVTTFCQSCQNAHD